MSLDQNDASLQLNSSTKSLVGLGLRKLSENVVITLTRQLLGTVTGTLSVLLLARMLEPEGYGLYSVVILLPNLLITLASFGLPSANIYYISRQTVSVNIALRTSFRFWLLISLAMILLSVIAMTAWGDILFPEVPSELLAIGLLAFPMSLLNAFLASIIHGLQDFRRLNTVQAIIAAATLGLVLVIVGIFQLGVTGALLAYILGNTISIVLYMRGLRLYLKREQQINKISNVDYWRQSLSYGWKAALSNIITFVNYRVDIYVINLYLNPASLGIYALSVRIAEQLGQLSGAVSTVLLPRVSELHTDENRQRAITPIAARWTLYLTGTLALVVVVIGRLVIDLLGVDYNDSFDALVVLLPGIVSLALARVLANDIAARGRPDLNIYTSLITIMIEVPAIFLLVQPLGVIGAGIASTIAYTAQALTSITFYARLSGNVWWLSVAPNRSDVEILTTGLALLRQRVQARRSN